MNGGFASFHPVPCFFYYTGVIVFAMLFFHPIFLLTALVLLLVLNVLHKRSQQLRRLFSLYLVLGGALIVLNPLFSQRGVHILFYFLERPITLEAVVYGCTMMLSVLVILLAFLSYHYVITTDKLMYLFSRFAPKTTLLAMMAIRFVPLLRRRLHQIALVQRTKGVSIYHGSLAKRARDGMKLLHILLIWSLEEALQTADSMKGRGYGTAKRSFYFPYRMERRDWTVLLALGVTGIVCIAGWGIGYGVLPIYPRLGHLLLTPAETVIYVVFCIYLLIPLWIEGKERKVWQRLK
ncbi:energy-coupling factor transporter transmembrane component T [Aneurinibacillus thermoaerophilus]|uniref:energy-coupling factor transporter transmembrane component T n=1 Tax=Aneurinibacillus thermoaerophilus TaxID=143495 RepID=UPI002E1F69FD|nr:energy-coupling factor transporter transmembrane component T [Aneurinibacillus thermoaerophilus]MED0738020.1 energy-coupling factor transporter transmembrane component T [Aneurinibacillus thermoaerophilus]MED0764335.1 energy-coupling factor transporter transmembrane component T [Aneurinibacillus thermoaerophilus]